MIYEKFTLSASKWEKPRELNSQRRHSTLYAVGHWEELKPLWSYFSPCNDKFYSMTAAGGVSLEEVWERKDGQVIMGKMLIASGRDSFFTFLTIKAQALIRPCASRIWKTCRSHQRLHITTIVWLWLKILPTTVKIIYKFRHLSEII